MTAAVAPAPSMFAVFRKRDFTLLWLAQLVSTAGSALTMLAAGIFVWRVTESTLAVSLTLIVTALPSLIVGLLAGVYVDRHDRRAIMIVTCLVQAVIVGSLAVVIGIEAIALAALYVLTLLDAGVKQFFDPAHDSLIPEIASEEELAAANSFLSIASFGSTAIGFAGAGLLAGTVGLQWAFLLDAASFLFAAGCIALMGRYVMPQPDDEASVGVIVANLRAGLSTLAGTPVIRSIFVVAAIYFFAVGIWNVMLLPFSIKVLGASEFQYGLQEALTSVGFVFGSFFMARFSRLLPEPAWMAVAMAAMGVCSFLYGISSQVGAAVLIVTISGFANAPSAIARSTLLQRTTPRDMRGRVFSAFYVLRDIVFVVGMAAAGLADVIGIRTMIFVSAIMILAAAGFVLIAPGLSVATWRAAGTRLREAEAMPVLAASPARAATMADFDRLVGRLTAFGRLSPAQRQAFVSEATVRQVPGGTRIVEHGETASSAYFILDGETTAGIPVEDGYRGLSTMTSGDFFGEIAALTGSPRTADVVADVDTTLLEVPADALRATMVVPEVNRVVLSTMTSRLQRTEAADLPRLAGIDQADLRDLRTPRPQVEALPRSYDTHEGTVL
jgi:CRP-like cAMP-binding protein/predicted MFS family arabinose efflux permease